MSMLVKGGNTFVPTVPLRLAVRGAVDVAALLLTERGRVRGDADVVFHGAPVHPSGAVRLFGDEGGTAWLETGLPAVEQEVFRVLVVASTENGALRDAHGLSVEAFAPDGTPVARYDVTDAGGETAMVLAELYRRAGGWKFRAVGQGYLNGLDGLATDHGVDVAQQPPAAAPAPAALPAPPAFQVPAAPPAAYQAPPTPAYQAPAAPPPAYQAPPAPAYQAPAAPPPAYQTAPTVPSGLRVPVTAPVPPAFQVPAFAPPHAPVPAAGPKPSDQAFGPVFQPRLLTGRDNDVIDAEGLPPGPVVVELSVRGDGYTGLWPLNRFNKQGDSLVNSTEDDFLGRLLTTVPAHGRLRLRLEAEGPWEVRVLPLAAARHLTEDTMECRGPDVLLHTGGTADLAFHYRGDDNFIVYVYELAEHDDPTTLPRTRGSAVNEIGRRRETLPLPEGPLVVQLMMADGPWSARLKRLRPHRGR